MASPKGQRRARQLPGPRMKFHGRPAGGLRKPTALETFVRDLVAAIDALGEAEVRVRTANSTSTFVPPTETALDDRLFSCEANLHAYLDKLTVLAHERPVELEKTQALLAHHKFRMYTDDSVLEVSKARIKTLCELLALDVSNPEISTHAMNTDRFSLALIGSRRSSAHRHERSAPSGNQEQDESQASFLGRAHHRSLGPRPASAPFHRHGRVARQQMPPMRNCEAQPVNLREIALAMMTPQARGTLLRRSFQEWKQTTRDVQAACGIVWSSLRLCKQRRLALAFGRWSRHAAFYRGAVHIRARDVRREHLMKLQQQQHQQNREHGAKSHRSGLHHKSAQPPVWDAGVKERPLNAKGVIPIRDNSRDGGRPMPWDPVADR